MGKRSGNRTPKQLLLLQQAAALVTSQPQGKGPRKCTPKTIVEQQELAQEELFEPGKVFAERMVRGALQYEVRWVRYSAKYDSWGPLVNLPGSEDLIRDFRKTLAEKNGKLAVPSDRVLNR